MVVKRNLAAMAFAVLTATAVAAQNGPGEIGKALSEKKYTLADSLLKQKLQYFFSAIVLDSLPPYSRYIGEVEEGLLGREAGIKKMNSYLEIVKSLSPKKKTLAEIYSEASEYIGNAGK